MRFTVPASGAGGTLAAALRGAAPGLAWRAAKALCVAGRVAVDGVATRDPAARVARGAVVDVLPMAAAPAREGLIVHLDAAVAVVEKPAGILTTPVRRSDRDTLLHRAAAAVRRDDARRGRTGSPTLRAVQRLDRDTSGLVVFARTVGAERALQSQLKGRTVWRRYLALVAGHAHDATLTTHLVEDRGDGLRGSWERTASGRRGEAPPESARVAITHVSVERRFADATLVACRLETGRQHQIRIHLSEAGTPLLGETIYVRNAAGKAASRRAPRPMLHAAGLGFLHPTTHRELRFESPPPPDFTALLSALAAPAGAPAGDR